MSLELAPLSYIDCLSYMIDKGCELPSDRFDFCISVSDGEKRRGAIGMYADGTTCKLGHLYTDGTALVGSILYGAAYRAAKALGYKEIVL